MTYLINMFTYNDNVLIFALLRVDKNGVQEKNKQIFSIKMKAEVS